MKINTHIYNALIHTWCMSSRGDCAKTNTYVAGNNLIKGNRHYGLSIGLDTFFI